MQRITKSATNVCNGQNWYFNMLNVVPVATILHFMYKTSIRKKEKLKNKKSTADEW